MNFHREWHTEFMEPRETDPVTGVKFCRFTSAPLISNNVYGEEPCSSSDGKRFAFTRFSIPDSNIMGAGNTSLWVCDLNWMDNPVSMVESSIISLPGCAKYTGNIYYQRKRNGRRELARLSLDSLETEAVFDLEEDRLLENVSGLVSASSDGRYYVALEIIRRPQNCRLLRLDLMEKKWKIIHENFDIINPHLQVSPADNDILIQHNRGGIVGAEKGQRARSTDDRGATLYTIDMEGKNLRNLPLGKPFTEPITGHQAWIGKTGEVIATIHPQDLCAPGYVRDEESSREAGFRKGTLFAAFPGEQKPRVVTKGYMFGHISVSEDGRFYVGDVGNVPGRPLVVGSVETGRAMVVGKAGDSRSYPQFTHPHPYFTADNRWIIFNSDKSGIPQIYGAMLPEYLLEALAEK